MDFAIKLHKIWMNFAIKFHKIWTNFAIKFHKIRINFAIKFHKTWRNFAIKFHKIRILPKNSTKSNGFCRKIPQNPKNAVTSRSARNSLFVFKFGIKIWEFGCFRVKIPGYSMDISLKKIGFIPFWDPLDLQKSKIPKISKIPKFQKIPKIPISSKFPKLPKSRNSLPRSEFSC